MKPVALGLVDGPAYGGKAVALGALVRAGLRVPGGIALPAPFVELLLAGDVLARQELAVAAVGISSGQSPCGRPRARRTRRRRVMRASSSRDFRSPLCGPRGSRERGRGLRGSRCRVPRHERDPRSRWIPVTPGTRRRSSPCSVRGERVATAVPGNELPTLAAFVIGGGDWTLAPRAVRDRARRPPTAGTCSSTSLARRA